MLLMCTGLPFLPRMQCPSHCFHGRRQGTDNGEGIVVKKHLSGFVDIPVQKLLDHYRNIGVDGAARAAERLFAVQAAPGFVDDMQRHGFSLYMKSQGASPPETRLKPH